MRLWMVVTTMAATILGWAPGGAAQTELVVAGYGGSFETIFKQKLAPSFKKKFSGHLAEIRIDGRRLALLKQIGEVVGSSAGALGVIGLGDLDLRRLRGLRGSTQGHGRMARVIVRLS